MSETEPKTFTFHEVVDTIAKDYAVLQTRSYNQDCYNQGHKPSSEELTTKFQTAYDYMWKRIKSICVSKPKEN